jgi:hypothetical protein
MSVDDAERAGLLAQMDEHAGEHDMLEHVGEIAGMEGVTVIQNAAPFLSAAA